MATVRDRRRTETLRWAGVLGITLTLALSFQGTRGLWEPDEGFYANVAAGMAATGDWWIPRLNGKPFLDKPPLHYWSMAAGIRLFGSSELSLRAPHALWFTATALLVGLFAVRFWGRRAGPLGTLAYAVMLAPFIAANVLTPDTVLTFWVTAMAYAYWRARSSFRQRQRFGWTVAAGACAGFGLLAKGPALLVFGLPLAIHGLVTEGWGAVRRLEVVVAGVVAVAIGGSWYAAVAQLLPGAAEYVFDTQVAGRLWSEDYSRNAGLLGPIIVYLPSLLAGGLPWSLYWPGSLRRLLRSLQRSGVSSLRQRPAALLVLLWVVVPLGILSLARSRLPLYILPVMPALGLAAVARLRSVADNARYSIRRSWLPRAVAWVVLLVAIKAASAYWPSTKDSRRLAESLERFGVHPSAPIFTVHVKRNALALYGYRNLTQVRHWSPPYPFYSPHAELEAVLADIGSDKAERLFLVGEDKAAMLQAELDSRLEPCRRLGASAGTVIIACGRGVP